MENKFLNLWKKKNDSTTSRDEQASYMESTASIVDHIGLTTYQWKWIVEQAIKGHSQWEEKPLKQLVVDISDTTASVYRQSIDLYSLLCLLHFRILSACSVEWIECR